MSERISAKDARKKVAYLDTWVTLVERDRLAWALLRHNPDYRREWGRAFQWLRGHMANFQSQGRKKTAAVRLFLTLARLFDEGDVASGAIQLSCSGRAFRSLRSLARRWKVQRLEDPRVESPEEPVFVPRPSKDAPPRFELSPIFIPEPAPAPMPDTIRLHLTPTVPIKLPDSVPYPGPDAPVTGPRPELWLNLWIRLDRSDAEVLHAVREARREARKERGLERGLRGKRFDYEAAVRVLPLLRRRPVDWIAVARALDSGLTAQVWARLPAKDQAKLIEAAQRRMNEYERLVRTRWWDPLMRGPVASV